MQQGPVEQQGHSSAFGRGYGATLSTPSTSAMQRARITDYARWLAAHRGPSTDGYRELWQWSVDHPADFWTSIWDYFDVLGQRAGGPVIAGDQLPEISWFSGTTLNYSRNALRTAATDPDRTALIYRSEAGHSGSLRYGELDAQVAVVRAALVSLGVERGDRVAAYLPNSPQALIGLLATASLGAIWTSCSPDFGAPAVVDRFAQVTPKVFIAVDGYVYNGKPYDRRPEVVAIASELPGLAAMITVDYLGTGWGSDGPAPPVRALAWETVIESPGEGQPGRRTEFAAVPFNHPLWVLYSSGTTGLPKPIVHGHGGIVLEHLKALGLHQDIGRDDVFFWYTTTGWMMWNYLCGALLAGATAVAYDGAATYPGTDELWRLAAETGVTYLGTGAPYLIASMKAGLRQAEAHDLSRLRGVGSTGSPLPPESFDWVYDAVAGDGRAHRDQDFVLGSFSGGTDLCTGFVGPNPLLPVRSGIIAGCCLGAKVEAFDGAGRPVIGEVGELVLTVPMPSMPVGFWGDASGERYRSSYYADYPGVWRHGDWIMFLPDGGCVIYGRSDATLNRGGVRMGTSEFYRVVEELPEVADSLVIDTGTLGTEGRLILYVVLAPGATHGRRADLPDQVRAQVGAVATARARRNPRGARGAENPVGQEAGDPGAQDPHWYRAQRGGRSGLARQPRGARLLRSRRSG